MGVQVDQPGRDQLARRVDHLAGFARQARPDRGDASVFDRDIQVAAVATARIAHLAACQQQVPPHVAYSGTMLDWRTKGLWLPGGESLPSSLFGGGFAWPVLVA